MMRGRAIGGNFYVWVHRCRSRGTAKCKLQPGLTRGCTAGSQLPPAPSAQSQAPCYIWKPRVSVPSAVSLAPVACIFKLLPLWAITLHPPRGVAVVCTIWSVCTGSWGILYIDSLPPFLLSSQKLVDQLPFWEAQKIFC